MCYAATLASASRAPLVDDTLDGFQEVMGLNLTVVSVCGQAAA